MMKPGIQTPQPAQNRTQADAAHTADLVMLMKNGFGIP